MLFLSSLTFAPAQPNPDPRSTGLVPSGSINEIHVKFELSKLEAKAETAACYRQGLNS